MLFRASSLLTCSAPTSSANRTLHLPYCFINILFQNTSSFPSLLCLMCINVSRDLSVFAPEALKEPSFGSNALTRATKQIHNAVYLRKLGDLHFYLTNNPSTSRKWIFFELSSTVLSTVQHLGLLSHLEAFTSPGR